METEPEEYTDSQENHSLEGGFPTLIPSSVSAKPRICADPSVNRKQLQESIERRKQELEVIDAILDAVHARETPLKQVRCLHSVPTIAPRRKIHEYCRYVTRDSCFKNNRGRPCSKLHFTRLIPASSRGQIHEPDDCVFLSQCNAQQINGQACTYAHYRLDLDPESRDRLERDLKRDEELEEIQNKDDHPEIKEEVWKSTPDALRSFFRIGSWATYEPQYIKCDPLVFDLSVLGCFDVVVITELPRKDGGKDLCLPLVQQDGLLFLWTASNNLDKSRAFVTKWGYRIIDELVWVHTDQLQRISGAGSVFNKATFSHAKDHCLVAAVGTMWKRHKAERLIDSDVIVSEVTSDRGKPKEFYDIVERIVGRDAKKLVIHSREKFTKRGWLSIGPELPSPAVIVDADIQTQISSNYPHGIESIDTSRSISFDSSYPAFH